MDLNDAIAELRLSKAVWREAHVATILRAVLSGQLIPLETCNARVAAMVEAAAGVAINEAMNGNDPRTTIRALTDADAQAALDAMISRAREVKPLVWKQAALVQENRLITGISDTGVGIYTVSQDGAWFSLRLNGVRFGGTIPNEEAAKAAAQADYTARIHAALRANATDASEGDR